MLKAQSGNKAISAFLSLSILMLLSTVLKGMRQNLALMQREDAAQRGTQKEWDRIWR